MHSSAVPQHYFASYYVYTYMIRKFSVDEKIFSVWNEKNAYVLGYIYADGHLQDVPLIRAQYLRITSTDKDRLTYIRNVLKSTHPIIPLKKQQSHHKDKFLLSIGSKILYSDLVRIGLHPAKSMDMVLPTIPKEYFAHFIRGYFDGDGCLFIERRPSKDTQRINVHRLSLIFTSGSKKFLEQLGRMMHTHDVANTLKIYKNGRSFQMRFSTKEALEICNFMYRTMSDNAYMKRKKNVFDEYVEARKLRM